MGRSVVVVRHTATYSECSILFLLIVFGNNLYLKAPDAFNATFEHIADPGIGNINRGSRENHVSGPKFPEARELGNQL